MNRTTKTMLWGLALTAAAVACGADGASGSAGKDGESGKAGSDGKAGSEGKPGTPAAGSSSSGGASAAHTLSFAPVSAPATDEDKRAVLATSKARIDGRDAPISFVTEARSGQAFGAATFGLIVDKNGAPIKNADGSSFVSPSSDFSSILKESAWRRTPAARCTSTSSARTGSSAATTWRGPPRRSSRAPGWRTPPRPTPTRPIAPTSARTPAR